MQGSAYRQHSWHLNTKPSSCKSLQRAQALHHIVDLCLELCLAAGGMWVQKSAHLLERRSGQIVGLVACQRPALPSPCPSAESAEGSVALSPIKLLPQEALAEYKIQGTVNSPQEGVSDRRSRGHRSGDTFETSFSLLEPTMYLGGIRMQWHESSASLNGWRDGHELCQPHKVTKNHRNPFLRQKCCTFMDAITRCIFRSSGLMASNGGPGCLDLGSLGGLEAHAELASLHSHLVN